MLLRRKGGADFVQIDSPLSHFLVKIHGTFKAEKFRQLSNVNLVENKVGLLYFLADNLFSDFRKTVIVSLYNAAYAVFDTDIVGNVDPLGGGFLIVCRQDFYRVAVLKFLFQRNKFSVDVRTVAFAADLRVN